MNSLKSNMKMLALMLTILPTVVFARVSPFSPQSPPPGSDKIWPVTLRALEKGYEYLDRAFVAGKPLTVEDKDCILSLLLEARANTLVKGGEKLVAISKVISGMASVQNPSKFIASVQQGIENNKKLGAWAKAQSDICKGPGARGGRLYDAWKKEAGVTPDTINELSYAQVVEQAPSSSKPALEQIGEALRDAPPALRVAAGVVGFIIVAGTSPIWGT